MTGVNGVDTIKGMTYSSAALSVAAVGWFVVGWVFFPIQAAQSLQYMFGLLALASAAAMMSAAVIAVCTGKLGDLDD